MCKKMRKCRHCGEFFMPVASCRHHQKYCSKPACQKARKAKNNRRFRQRNPDYFKGPDQVRRVQEWRSENPGYWRRAKRQRAKSSGSVEVCPDALQVVSSVQGPDDTLVALQHKLDALQAVSDWQNVVIQGVACHMGGVALQAELAEVIVGLYDQGDRFGPVCGPVKPPFFESKKTDRECETFAVSGASSPVAAQLQLGGSSSDP